MVAASVVSTVERRRGRPRGVTADGLALRGQREDLGLSRRELGARIGVTSRTIKRAEDGEPISLVLLRRIALALMPDEPVLLREELRAAGRPRCGEMNESAIGYCVPTRIRTDPEISPEPGAGARPRSR